MFPSGPITCFETLLAVSTADFSVCSLELEETAITIVLILIGEKMSMLRLIMVLSLAFTTPSVWASNITILVLGDSISSGYGLASGEGWVNLLDKHLNHKNQTATIINSSITGDTSVGGLRRTPQALATHKPDIVILELGGNDGLRGLSLKELRLNLIEITTLSLQAGAKVLVLGMRIPSNYGEAYTERFHRVFSKVADKTSAALMPFFLEPIAMQRDSFQDDGIHPNATAQPLLLGALLPYLAPLLEVRSNF